MFGGIDIGTSGARAVVIDAEGRILAEASEPMDAPALGEGVDANGWLRTARAAIGKLAVDVRCSLKALAVDGTSGSMVLVDGENRPVTPGLLYVSKGFESEARAIASAAPEGSIARGSGSALARLLRLQSLGEGTHLAHQADLITAALTGHPGRSDESNALKTGYDARSRSWPLWMERAGATVSLLPEVAPVGTVLGEAHGPLAQDGELSPDAIVVAGATDSVAAFLAAGVREPGVAVTSLGTTLALKVLADRPVEDAARGIYSHRIDDLWLPGGASNVGGGALLQRFSRDELTKLSARIDQDWEPRHPETYPLPRTGERFPRNDPAMEPVLPPRDGDPRFLFELLHAIARVEREGYEALRSLGAPYPSRVLSAGGGARNPVWTAIRERVLGVPVETLEHADAAYGMALLARDALPRG